MDHLSIAPVFLPGQLSRQCQATALGQWAADAAVQHVADPVGACFWGRQDVSPLALVGYVCYSEQCPEVGGR